MSFKKFLTVLLSSSLIFSACSEDQDENTNDEESSETPDKPGENTNPEQKPGENTDPEQKPGENTNPEQKPGENTNPEQKPGENTDPEQKPGENTDPEQKPGENTDPEQNPGENANISEEDKNRYQAAMLYNEYRHLPIRFVLKLKQVLGTEIDRSSLASAVKFTQTDAQKIAEYQNQWFGNSRYGIIDAETYLKIKHELFDEKEIHSLIGHYTTPNAILIQDLTQSYEVDQTVYDRCRHIIEEFGGYFDTTPGTRNILGLRGAIIDQSNIRRTQTADLYFQNINDTNPDPKGLIHFASDAELNPEAGAKPYDDTMLVIWTENDKYYVQPVPLSLDPGMQWGSVNGGDFDGSAHLRDGQYIGVIGRHATSLFPHAYAVLNACYESTYVYDLLAPQISNKFVGWDELESWLNQSGLPRTSYTGINNIYDSYQYNGQTITASGTSEVIRDFHFNGGSCDGILKTIESDTANKVLANLYPSDELLTATYPDLSISDALDEWFMHHFARYSDEECRHLFGKSAEEIYREDNKSLRANQFKHVYIRYHDSGHDIGINIHTSPDDMTSSQGCLNIPISSYPGFISSLIDAHAQTHYLYTIVDASKVRGLEE